MAISRIGHPPALRRDMVVPPRDEGSRMAYTGSPMPAARRRPSGRDDLVLLALLLVCLIASAASGPSHAACTYEAFEWTERFEAKGYDEVYDEPSLAHPANEIWPDARTSSLRAKPGAPEIPEAWGREFLLVRISDIAGGALTRTELDRPLVSLSSHLEFLVLENAMAEGSWITLAVAKNHGGPGEMWPVAWSAHLNQRAGTPTLEVRVGTPPLSYFAPLAQGVNALDVSYDSNGSFVLLLNGVQFATGPVVGAYDRRLWWLIVGASGSSTGRNVSVALDNFVHRGIACVEY